MAVTCSECGAANIEAARFCNECGVALKDTEAKANVLSKRTSMAEKMAQFAARQPKAKADILFVLDTTSSMQGEIDAIRDAIIGVVSAIENDGVESRVGLLEFRDRLIDEEHRVLTFNGQVFINDAQAFKDQVSTLKARGGGDIPESSLDALYYAAQQPFAEDSQNVIVLITDAPPHIPDKQVQSIDEVLAAFTQANISQFYPVIHTQEVENKVYLRLFEGRKGLAFELGQGDDFRSRSEHFKRTLINLQRTISQATRRL